MNRDDLLKHWGQGLDHQASRQDGEELRRDNGCPSEELLAAVFEGKLRSKGVLRAWWHVRSCSFCSAEMRALRSLALEDSREEHQHARGGLVTAKPMWLALVTVAALALFYITLPGVTPDKAATSTGPETAPIAAVSSAAASVTPESLEPKVIAQIERGVAPAVTDASAEVAAPPVTTSEGIIDRGGAGEDAPVLQGIRPPETVVLIPEVSPPLETSPSQAQVPIPAPLPVAMPLAAEAPVATRTSSPPAARDRIRIAIAPFKFSAPFDDLSTLFGTQDNVGAGIKALLTKEITNGGQLTVVETDLASVNSALTTVMSNRGPQSTGPRLGSYKSVDFVLEGDILIFGRDEKKVRAGGGGIMGGVIGGIGASKSSNKAIVSIAYRLVDAQTREVVASEQARGESKREDKNIFGGVLKGVSGGVGGVDMTSSNFQNTTLGEATQNSVAKLALAMNQKIQAVPARLVTVEGKVSQVSGGQVTISQGADGGVKVGDVFEISQIISEVKDPDTGDVLDLQVKPVGTLTITEVRPKIGIGSYVGATPAVGYVARRRP